MSDKHPIRNGIIIGVILAIILSPWLRQALLKLLYALQSLAVFLCGLLAHRVPVPVWLLTLLCCLSLYPIFRLVKALRSNEPSTSQYTTDEMFGVRWRWRYGFGRLDNLWAFCPRCDLELVYHEQRSDGSQPSLLDPAEFTQFVCEKCSIRSLPLSGNESHALDRVEREIRRKIRTGEWKGITNATHC